MIQAAKIIGTGLATTGLIGAGVGIGVVFGLELHLPIMLCFISYNYFVAKKLSKSVKLKFAFFVILEGIIILTSVMGLNGGIIPIIVILFYVIFPSIIMLYLYNTGNEDFTTIKLVFVYFPMLCILAVVLALFPGQFIYLLFYFRNPILLDSQFDKCWLEVDYLIVQDSGFKRANGNPIIIPWFVKPEMRITLDKFATKKLRGNEDVYTKILQELNIR